MTPSSYVPERGDFIFLDFTPQAGHEQAGRRPGMVISPRGYNERSGLCLVCPITNQVKGYPFEVAITPGESVTGVVLSDQVKSVDWVARNASFRTKARPEFLAAVLAKLRPLLGY